MRGISVEKIQEKTQHVISLQNPPYHYKYVCNLARSYLYLDL